MFRLRRILRAAKNRCFFAREPWMKKSGERGFRGTGRKYVPDPDGGWVAVNDREVLV